MPPRRLNPSPGGHLGRAAAPARHLPASRLCKPRRCSRHRCNTRRPSSKQSTTSLRLSQPDPPVSEARLEAIAAPNAASAPHRQKGPDAAPSTASPPPQRHRLPRAIHRDGRNRLRRHQPAHAERRRSSAPRSLDQPREARPQSDQRQRPGMGDRTSIWPRDRGWREAKSGAGDRISGSLHDQMGCEGRTLRYGCHRRPSGVTAHGDTGDPR